MLRCPVCNSSDYHIMPGYGSWCEHCGFERDGEGQTMGGDNDE
ncbi:MAG: hypothetical protein AB1629_01090 [Candidatus Omnitrophota bacterium]